VDEGVIFDLQWEVSEDVTSGVEIVGKWSLRR
jgi:hypothetical protein